MITKILFMKLQELNEKKISPDRWFKAEPKERLNDDGEVVVEVVRLRHRVDKGQTHFLTLGHQVLEQLLVRPLGVKDRLNVKK